MKSIIHSGLGARGGQWLDIVADRRDVTSACLVDTDPLALQKASRSHPGLPTRTNLEEALRDYPEAEVLIATPPDAHADQIAESLTHNRAVLVEKPLASNLKDAVRAFETVKALNGRVIVAHNYRYRRAEQTLRHLLEERVGALGHVSIEDLRARVPSGNYLDNAAYAQVLDVGCHHFDTLRFLCNANPVNVVARCSRASAYGYRHGATTEALLELEGGLQVQYFGTLAAHRWEYRMSLDGELGTLNQNNKRVRWRKRGRSFFMPQRLRRIDTADTKGHPREGTTGVLNELLYDFTDGYKSGASTRIEQAIWTQVLIEAVMRSDQESRKVHIDEVLSEHDCLGELTPLTMDTG